LDFRMTVWDQPAVDRLEVIAADLQAVGVLDLFERLVARTWRYNCQRYEPAEAGDTPRSLGVTASENLRVQVLREVMAPTSAWAERGVVATAPENSLLVQACGVNLRQMKAPASPSRFPAWQEFTWSRESETRLSSAEANTRTYGAEGVPPGQEVLPGILPSGDPAALRHVLLVWSGDVETGRTAAWLGLPVLGDYPWLAVRRLWWHEDGVSLLDRAGHRASPSPESFADRPQPVPRIALKPRAGEAGRS
jgi:hypothetical protein